MDYHASLGAHVSLGARKNVGEESGETEELVDMTLWSLREIGQNNPALLESALPLIKRLATEHDKAAIRRRASEVLKYSQTKHIVD